MAGYNYRTWKSNNAEVAEANGLLIATQVFKRLKIDSRFILDHVRYEEKHHTSSMYNMTKYYDIEVVRDFLKKNNDLYQQYLHSKKDGGFAKKKFAKTTFLILPKKKRKS